MLKFKKYKLHVIIIVILIVLLMMYICMNQKKYTIKKSPIHGVGLFAKEDIGSGEILDCAIKKKGDKFIITPHFGKLINHSKTADNVDLIQFADGYYIKTIKYIPKNSEILANYDGPTIPSFIKGSMPHYI